MASRRVAHALSHHSPGSASAKPGAGENNCDGREAAANTSPFGRITTATVDVVPISSPTMQASEGMFAFRVKQVDAACVDRQPETLAGANRTGRIERYAEPRRGDRD